MYEAELMLTGYTIVVVTCTAGISRFLNKKRNNRLQKDIEGLKKTISTLKNDHTSLKANDSP